MRTNLSSPVEPRLPSDKMKDATILYNEKSKRHRDWYVSITMTFLIIPLLLICIWIISLGNWENADAGIIIGLLLLVIVPIIGVIIALFTDFKYQAFSITTNGIYPPEKEKAALFKKEFIPKDEILIIQTLIGNHELVGIGIKARNNKNYLIHNDVGDLNVIKSILLDHNFPLEDYELRHKRIETK